jgi:NTE family protein
MARPQKSPPFECVALTLQGGGALGAYQAGVYQALAEADLHPDWVAGISIGAINSAIIAGNAPEARVEKLSAFWESITSTPFFDAMGEFGGVALGGDAARKVLDQMSAASTLAFGVAGFFALRIPPPYFDPPGSQAATSYYDTKPLWATLERLVDFDRINSRKTRLSVGSVNVESGNFVYFDSATRKIGPEHVMASAALPPGFPAIAIDGEHYWDGGVISNTPLQWVLQSGPGARQDTLVFEVDLWSARGRFPRDMAEVATREKEIRYSSRTRENTHRFEENQRLRHMIAKLMAELPRELAKLPSAAALTKFADHKVYNIVHLIYRSQSYEGQSKDYEFSQLSMRDHWKAGYKDTIRTLRHPDVLKRPKNEDGIKIFDCTESDSA